MPPKKAAEPAPVVEEAETQEEEVEPAEPEILKKCFRVGSQTYYGDCKLGYGPRRGTFVRHGFGRQINAAVSPAGYKSNLKAPAYETSVMGVYEGNWEDDVMSGQGVYQWSDGSSYDGAFVSGQMHGPGRFMWPDGSTYEGTWHSGQMTGHGRLDYKFDGSFWQGRFQRDAFQRHESGHWVDVWKQTREIERTQILSEQPSPLIVKRCACSELYAGSASSLRELQIDDLQRVISSVQNQGYMPFIISDQSLKCSPLKCLEAAKLARHATQSVSIRTAALKKRRKQDFNGMFFSAIQQSLLTGSLFSVVFEDDNEGCELLSKEDNRWFDRKHSVAPATKSLPPEWQFKHFYNVNMFPAELLHPMLFNGRLMSKLFLPEALREDSKEVMPHPAQVAPEAAPRAAGPGDLPPPDGEERQSEPRAVEGMSPAAAAQAAAAEGPKITVCGLTGHCFELKDVPDPRAVGLRMVHHLRPAIVALSGVPSGMSDEAVSERIVDRFKAHVPMHRTMLILLTHESTMEPER